VENGITVLGPVNVPASIAYHASQLYSRNLTTLLKEIISEGTLTLDQDDEIVAATLILRDGSCPDKELAETLGVSFHTAEEAK
jgi:NAD(P) transhydrogenase subunit alpha